MSKAKREGGTWRPWSERSTAAKVGIIIAIVVAVPGLAALCGAVIMWLWNWLMPYLFKLPEIGFWQAIGVLLLSQLLFRGSHSGRVVRTHWKKRQVWNHMQEDEEKANGSPLQS